MTRVTLLTDFGTADGYAAAMAGVIAAASPEAVVEHASHDVAPGDVLSAALTLHRYARLYPEGTIHVVVVDPGVGTHRRALAARIDGRAYVAPDNGVLTRVLQGAREAALVAVAPREPTSISATFHGRDLFAPTAGRLARGEPLDALGSPVSDPVLLPLPEPERQGDSIAGEVIQVDRFGNLISNIPGAWIEGKALAGRSIEADAPPGSVDRGAGAATVSVGGSEVGPLRRTYGDVEPGEVVALVGSLDLLEVSVRDGSAADRLRASRGTAVLVSTVSATRMTPEGGQASPE